MRWADLDVLNHVNNVTYLEYVAEAQALLVADGALRADAPTEVTVTFLAPVLLSSEPLTITSVLDSNTLTQEVIARGVVSARVVSTWDGSEPFDVPAEINQPTDIRVRVGDVDASGAVTVAKVFELFQESRILLISTQLPQRTVGKFVVGTVGVRVHRAVAWREAPYQAYGWMSRLGNGSLTIDSVIHDGDEPVLSATAVLVGFDPETQTSRAFDADERAAMEPAVIA